MLVAAVQTHPVLGAVQRNVEEALALMETAPAEMYVLPELCTTGYLFADHGEVERLAEPANGPSLKAFMDFARRRGVYVVAGFAERADRLYNSAAMIGPTGIVGIYRKVHLYDRENLFFEPGNLGFPVFPVRFGTVGIMICFDWMYPESVRSLTLGGADVIAHPSNLVLPYCPDAMVTRCIENRVFAVTADRVGREEHAGYGLTFIGSSQVVRPDGTIAKRLNSTDPGVAVADIDLAQAQQKKLNAFNDLLTGRRTDQYRN
jgi:5-aminopentanamidase